MNAGSEADHKSEAPVVIVGAGLAGLACACRLADAGVKISVYEASDRVGGRVATDQVDGFRLDRGFQVFLTAYPEAAGLLDYEALQLRPFYPGALIQIGRSRFRFADPWRHPLAGLIGLRSPIANLRDALRIARMRAAALRDYSGQDEKNPPTTLEYLRRFGLSDRVIDRFFRPFFAGVFLERALRTPGSFFRFVFSMFARGLATLPADGMQAIPRQLAARLPADSLHLNAAVESISGNCVRLACGDTLHARAVVVATDADAAQRLVPETRDVEWNGGTTVYFSSPISPIGENILLLNGNGRGLVNHVCVPSDVSARYAPPGASLVSVNTIGIPSIDDPELVRCILDELRDWFGDIVDRWELLRVYRIPRALPVCRPQSISPMNDGKPGSPFLCGDYLEGPSINGALAGGRKSANAVLSCLARA